jgi:AcrR family transcriptional regulator
MSLPAAWPVPTRSGRSGSTRHRLLDTAAALLAERGIDVPMADIAEQAGVTRMTLYRQLGTRDELLVAVLLHESRHVGSVVTAILDERVRPFPDRLVDAIVRVVAAVRASPVLSLFATRVSPTEVEELDGSEAFVTAVWALLQPYFEEPDVAATLRADPERSLDWTLRQVLLQLVVRGRSNTTEAGLHDELETFLVPSLFVRSTTGGGRRAGADGRGPGDAGRQEGPAGGSAEGVDDEVARLVDRLGDRPRVGLGGPYRQGTEELLPDERRGPVRVEGAEDPRSEAFDIEVLEEPGDVEADDGELGPDRGRTCWRGPGSRGLVGDEGEAEEGRVVVDALEHRLDERPEAPDGAVRPLPPARHGFEQLVVHSLEAGPQQLVPVGEVDVDRRSGDAGLLGDLVHRHLGRAPLAEEPPGDVDHLVAPEVA